MTTPEVTIEKLDNQTGVTKPAATGILAIIAPALAGAASAAAFADPGSVNTEYGYGPMHEDSAYVMPVTSKPVVCVGVDATTAGAYSAFTKTGGGTTTISAGGTEPVDNFSVVIQYPVAGTIGTSGIKYSYSIDGGNTFSRAQALGTATSFVIPNTGITVNHVTAMTVLTTTQVTFTTTAPALANADLTAALEALRVSRLQWEALYIDMDADATTVSTLSAWISALNTARGKFPTVVLTCSPKNIGTSETESAYLARVGAVFDAASCIDAVVCADVCDVTSPPRSMNMLRRTGLVVAARGMSVDLGVDPSYRALGPLKNGVFITDARSNPKYHDEELFPGLDDERFTTLLFDEEENGVFITNANLLSPGGSDYVYWQHARVMNRACEIAHQVLKKQLSGSFRKNPKPGPNGERYIDEGVAQHWEALANAKLQDGLKGQVDDVRVVLSRTDDVSSNQGAIINVRLEIVSLGYVKNFKVAAGYTTAIDTTQDTSSAEQ